MVDSDMVIVSQVLQDMNRNLRLLLCVSSGIFGFFTVFMIVTFIRIREIL